MQHGFLGGSGYFAPQMAALGGSYDIIAPDLPGFAGSSQEPVAPSIKALSKAQIALLDELEIARFSLLGHSMGGMVALQTALDHPERIEKLVLYATSYTGNLPGRFETFQETLQKVERDGLSDVADNITASWFHHEDAAPMYEFCRQAGLGASKAAVKAALLSFADWNVEERLGELKMPALVIAGDKDRSYNLAGLKRLANSIEQAEFCLMPGCAHCAHLENAELFNNTVEKFLTEQI